MKDWENETEIIGNIIRELTKKTHIQIDTKPIIGSGEFIGARHEHKRVRLTVGLLKCARERYLDREELEVILGHEFGHATKKVVFLKRWCTILLLIPFVVVFVHLRLWLDVFYADLYWFSLTGPLLFLIGR